ncbi:MAG: hypothetical protein R2781_12595, partial [Flavobacteriaceae bacterium]
AYSQFIMPLVKSVQELNEKVENQKTVINEKDNQIEILKSVLEKHSKQIEILTQKLSEIGTK